MSDEDGVECLRMSRPKLRKVAREGEGGGTRRIRNRSRSVKDTDLQMEVIRPGLIRNILSSRVDRVNIPARSILGGEKALTLVGVGEIDEPLATSENLDKTFDIAEPLPGDNKDEHENTTIPTVTFNEGDIVDVTVCLAISPSYFVIQQNSSLVSLEELSIHMFCFYEEQEEGVMVEKGRVVKGMVVAVRRDDGDWYRARVTELLTATHVMVRLLDYGELEMAELHDMRVLAAEFMELPAQGVNARLEGIMPKKGDWGREDEDWWLGRVEGEMFVVQVGESWVAGVDVGVEVIMFDTSKEEDIVLQEEMVQKDLAMYIMS